MSMMNAQASQNVDISRQENFNNTNFRQATTPSYSNLKNNANNANSNYS